MAPPSCMTEDGRPAVFVGTFLQTGDAVAVCDDCLVMFAAALLRDMTGLDPAPFLAAISDDQTDPGAEAPGQVPDVTSGALTTSEGAPSDEPPPPGPADSDQDPTPPPEPVRLKPGRGSRARSGPGTGTAHGTGDPPEPVTADQPPAA